MFGAVVPPDFAERCCWWRLYRRLKKYFVGDGEDLRKMYLPLRQEPPAQSTMQVPVGRLQKHLVPRFKLQVVVVKDYAMESKWRRGQDSNLHSLSAGGFQDRCTTIMRPLRRGGGENIAQARFWVQTRIVLMKKPCQDLP